MVPTGWFPNAERLEGEKVTTVVGHRWDPAAMDRVSGQLDAINASLMKLSRSERGV